MHQRLCLLNNDGHRVTEGSLCPLLVNLTVPFGALGETGSYGVSGSVRRHQPMGHDGLFYETTVFVPVTAALALRRPFHLEV